MGQKTEFKVNIGDIVTSYNRNLLIIDREYRTKEQKDRGKIYTGYRKYYKYRCLNCGNEDWISEYLLCGVKYHSGCNVCSEGSKKILKGYNDIATTAPWMMDYILDKEFCYTHAKSSLEKTKMKCPLCGDIKTYSPFSLSSNKDLPCKCKDAVHVGDRFGKLTVIKDSGERRVKTIKWECKCDCGNTILVATSDLINGSKTSCGCVRKKKVYIKKRTFEKPKFKLEIGDTITDNGRDLTIIDREYRPQKVILDYYVKTEDKTEKCECTRNLKYYKYKCNNCGNEDWLIEKSLCGKDEHSRGCNVCNGHPQKVLTGYNDIATVAPWMVQYFVDKEEAKNMFKYDVRKVKMVCPNCGKISMVSPKNVYHNHSLPCTCSDSLSYPNKFLYTLLDSNNIEFTPEQKFKWAGKKRYDAYIKLDSEDIIIEMHGSQHYLESNGFFRPLAEVAENDKYKENIALQNGVKHYYQINASISDCDYIKNSFIKSGLLDLLHINPENVDWEYCDSFATKNIDKMICEYHNNNPTAKMSDIRNVFKVGSCKISTAIKKGLKYGWCESSLLSSRDYSNRHPKKRPVYCKTNDKYYRSISIANSILKLRNTWQTVRNYVLDDRPCDGYYFEIISVTDFNEAKSKFPEKCFGDFFNIKENTA